MKRKDEKNLVFNVLPKTILWY